MARKVSFSALESRSARLRLKIRRRPYSGPSLARGISLMYRRNKTNGTWVLKASDGHGSYWTKGFALADDFEESDGKAVLTFYEAQDQAKKLARGEDGSADSAPITVDGAILPSRLSRHFFSSCALSNCTGLASSTLVRCTRGDSAL